MIELTNVKAHGVAKRGESKPELRGATVKLAAGLTVLVGPRAGGGPLVLDLVHGRVRPKSGTVRVLGLAAGDHSLMREMAYVPLAPEIPQGLTVQECVRVAFETRAKGPRTADAALERLGMSALRVKKTADLTQGEQRALLLAIAIACSPKVLLMEEPCTWFDARAQARVTEALRALASEGSAVIVTTQSSLDAERLGGRALRVENGLVSEASARAERPSIVIACERARELSALLSTLPSVEKMRLSGKRVLVTGKNATALTLDVTEAIVREGFDILSLEPTEETL